MTKKRVPPFPAEVRERAVRMVFEQEREHATQWTAICSVAGKIGCSGETLQLGAASRARSGAASGSDNS